MKILSSRSLLYLRRVFILGEKFCWHPYVWNYTNNLPELTASFVRLLVWVLNACLNFLYYGFLIWRCAGLNSTNASAVQILFMQFKLTFFSFPVFIELNTVYSLHEFPQFINIYLRYFADFEGKPLKNVTEIQFLLHNFLT